MKPPLDADVLVIGCGPGGSSAATFLTRAGRRVVVLEKERFPRFHVGESLLPYNRPLFEEMGVWETLATAGFPIKRGAQFHLANGTKSHRFAFDRGVFTRHTEVVQVERARFDHLLLQHARGCGADIREGWIVKRFAREPEGVTVETLDPEGASHTLRGRFLIDASGQANLTGHQEQLRVPHAHHRKVAVFGHFTGVQLADGEAGGDTVIIRGRDHWFWIIPVSAQTTSVGVVLDQSAFSADGGQPEIVWCRAVEASPAIQSRLARSERVGELRTAVDFSYWNRPLAAGRVLRVGDAAGFLDPIFSAGVYLAMWSGKLAARAINETLERGGEGARRLRRYDRRVFRAMRRYWRLVRYFYTTPFMELFLAPRPTLNLPAAVVAVLAGELEGGWRLRWRLEVFYLLVRLQGRWPLAPRIRWGGVPRRPRPASTPED